MKRLLALFTLRAAARLTSIHTAYQCKKDCFDREMPICTSLTEDRQSFCCESQLECKAHFRENFDCSYDHAHDSVSMYLACPSVQGVDQCGITIYSRQFNTEQICAYQNFSPAAGRLYLKGGQGYASLKVSERNSVIVEKGQEVTFSGVSLIVIVSDERLEIEYESNPFRNTGATVVTVDIK